MARSLNLSLTNELRAFLDQCSGDGTLYATPSEFVRAVLREKMEQMEAASIRRGILEGFQDVRENKVHQYGGDLKSLMDKVAESANE